MATNRNIVVVELVVMGIPCRAVVGRVILLGSGLLNGVVDRVELSLEVIQRRLVPINPGRFRNQRRSNVFSRYREKTEIFRETVWSRSRGQELCLVGVDKFP